MGGKGGSKGRRKKSDDRKEADQRAREIQEPMPPEPAAPANQGLWNYRMQGEHVQRKTGRGENGERAEPGKEELRSLEAPPSLEGPRTIDKPPIPEGPHSTEEDKYKRQKTVENEERNRAPREESVLEQGVENGVARPAREEVEDEFKAACRECGIAFVRESCTSNTAG